MIREVINVHSEELSRQWREDEGEESSTRSAHSSHRYEVTSDLLMITFL